MPNDSVTYKRFLEYRFGSGALGNIETRQYLVSSETLIEKNSSASNFGKKPPLDGATMKRLSHLGTACVRKDLFAEVQPIEKKITLILDYKFKSLRLRAKTAYFSRDSSSRRFHNGQPDCPLSAAVLIPFLFHGDQRRI
ncbi:hypothetical protein TNCV_2816301 [Trichonephila clavipes]|nr:hypothetical protein TNCV_2816301 [Trichonephila clavipes]